MNRIKIKINIKEIIREKILTIKQMIDNNNLNKINRSTVFLNQNRMKTKKFL